MEVTELAVAGTYEFVPSPAGDARGLVLEAMRADVFAQAAGKEFSLAQVNLSVSRRGVIRGVHYVALPGQEKYVFCVRGAVLDIAVDLRIGSPTFGAHAVTRLDDAGMQAVYMPIGVGHAYLSLTDDSTVMYLMSAPYIPERQRAVHPLDPELGLDWACEEAGQQPLLSPQDDVAPTLAAAAERDLLPAYTDCQRIEQRPDQSAHHDQSLYDEPITEPRRDDYALSHHLQHQARSRG